MAAPLSTCSSRGSTMEIEMPAWASSSSSWGVAWVRISASCSWNGVSAAVSGSTAGPSRPPSGAAGPSTGAASCRTRPSSVSAASRPRNFTPDATVPPLVDPVRPSCAETRSVMTESIVMTPPRMAMSLSSTRLRLIASSPSIALRDAEATVPTLTTGGASMPGNTGFTCEPSSSMTAFWTVPPCCEASTSVGPAG